VDVGLEAWTPVRIRQFWRAAPLSSFAAASGVACSPGHQGMTAGTLGASEDGVMSVPTGDRKPDATGMSRREGPRLEVEAVINGRLSRGNLRLDLIDLGLGGFAVESPIGFSPGSRHAFRFVTMAGLAVRVQADLVYSRPSGSHDGMDHFISGFKYVVADPNEQAAIDLLIEAATSPLSFL
jgi:hypothetical protein